MGLKYIPYLIPLFTATVISTILSIHGLRRRHAPSAIPFVLIMFFVAQWSLSYAFELGTVNLQTRLFWTRIKFLGIVLVPVAWFFFTLKHSGREEWLKLKKIAFLVTIPTITFFLIWTNEYHGLFWNLSRPDRTTPLPMQFSLYGPWFWVHTSYSYLLLFVGSILLIRTLIGSPYLNRGQGIALLISVLSPWAGNALSILNLSPFQNLDLTPFAFTLTGIGLAWSLFQFRLLDIVPAARETVIEGMSDAVIVMDAQNRIVDINPSAQRLVGRSPSGSIGQPFETVLSNWPDLIDRHRIRSEVHSETVRFENEGRRYFDLSISTLRDRHGVVTGRLMVLRDITERKQAEETLQNAHDELEKKVKDRTAELLLVNEQLKKEIEERAWAEEELKESLKLIGTAKREWESTTDSLAQLICLFDNWGYILRANRMVEKWNLGDVKNIKGKTAHELLHPNCPDPSCYMKDVWPEIWERVVKGKPADFEVEDQTLKRYLHFQVRPISPQKYAKDEEIASHAVAVVTDITETKRAERERTVLEDQLRQSQKMEAVGRLAGGIAHDFNNLLTPIVGYSQLARRRLSSGDPMRDYLQEIEKAAERAATLIRQLLTFSRRQPLKSQILNLNNVLMDMDKMLRRIIGEHIELITIPASNLGSVKVDPSQFEQVLVNLAINARDAMANGGKLILETSNVSFDSDYIHHHAGISPGNYVMVAISDTGCGMQPEIRERIFEPFFTTKGRSGGTGLGLSTVHGIIKESQGYILVYSEPDKGTTFKIYLPRVEAEAIALPPRDEIGYLPKGDETILLVEDETSVRNLTAHVLREQGYTVLEAANGSEALSVVLDRAVEPIHLLFTDVVMPQMGGKELAERLKTMQPNTKILFTSGYPDSTIIYQGLLDPDVDFIAKPLSPSSLARKVREVLDK
ncbi:MAG: histidine kinase N-terminal 7TM domain-containing protein [Thermodesulfobacteriota bacterium]